MWYYYQLDEAIQLKKFKFFGFGLSFILHHSLMASLRNYKVIQ